VIAKSKTFVEIKTMGGKNESDSIKNHLYEKMKEKKF